MKIIKRVLALIPPLTLWLMLCALVWGFVFTRITDARPEDKLAIYVDAETPGGTALAVALEDALGGQVRLVQVRPFSYAMFYGEALRSADLYIVRASDIETYRDWFAPLPGALAEDASLTADGVPLGIQVYDAETRQGIAEAYITYQKPGEAQEDCYLVFGASSRHNPDSDGAVDGLAVEAARLLLAMS